MKANSIPILILLSVLQPLAFVPAVRAEDRPLRIGIVDMTRVYAEYRKTREAEKRFESERYAVKKELDARNVRLRELVEKYGECRAAIADPAISESLRAEKSKEGQTVAAEARSLEREIEDFRKRREQQLLEQFKRMRSAIMQEILEAVREQSKLGNYDVVFDKSGLGVQGIPFLLHSRDAVDFSNEVLKKLNVK